MSDWPEKMECLALVGTWLHDSEEPITDSVGFLAPPKPPVLAAAAIQVMRGIRDQAKQSWVDSYLFQGRIEWEMVTTDLWDVLPSSPEPDDPAGHLAPTSSRRGTDPVAAGVIGFLIGTGIST